jgi:Ca2+-binding EF-hand superfamily protein
VDVWKTLAAKYDKNKDGEIDAKEYSRGEEKFRGLDRDRDGVLTKADFEGGRRSRGRSGGRGRGRGGFDFSRMMGARLVRAADADDSGDVSKAEWTTFLGTLSSGKDGVVDAEKLQDLLPSRRPGGGGGGERERGGIGGRMLEMLDRDGDEKVEVSDLEPLFAEVDRDESGTADAAELQSRGFGGRGGGDGGPGGRDGGRGRGDGGGLPQVGDAAPDFDLPFAKNENKTARLSSFAGKRPVALVFGSYT